MINIEKEYLNKDTCKFICDSLNKYTQKIPDPGIYGGVSNSEFAHKVKPSNPIAPYSNDPEYNVSIDLLTNLCVSMTRTISDFYGIEYVLRSLFYSDMQEGGKNSLHIDNFYLDVDTKKLLPRPGMENDRAGLLYLNNSYEGGEIEFPLQGLKMKPDPGTFIFFEGTEEVPHLVNEVKSGRRNNIICFFTPKENHEERVGNPIGGRYTPEVELTMEYFNQLNGTIDS